MNKSNVITKSDVSISLENGVHRMNISDSMPLNIFLEKVRELNPEDAKIILQLPLSILSNDSRNVTKGSYFWKDINNASYVIIINKDSIGINEKSQIDNIIVERMLYFDLRLNRFRISRSLHESQNNNSTIENKSFDSAIQQPKNNLIESFILEADEALEEADTLFKNVEHEEEILDILKERVDLNKIKESIYLYFSSRMTEETSFPFKF